MLIGYLATPGAWLAPVGWLAVSSLMLTDGPDGVWVGLVLVPAPLAALSMTPGAASASAAITAPTAGGQT